MKIFSPEKKIKPAAPKRAGAVTVEDAARQRPLPWYPNGLLATFTMKVKEFARNPATANAPNPAGPIPMVTDRNPLVLSLFGVAQRLGQFEQPLTHLRVTNPIIRAHQFESFAAGQGVGVQGPLRLIAEAPSRLALPDRHDVGHVVKEERNRHVKDPAEFKKPRSANPIGASFVLLNLLKCEPNRFPKLLLAQTKKSTAEPHATADMDINRVWRTRRQPLYARAAGRSPSLSSPRNVCFNHCFSFRSLGFDMGSFLTLPTAVSDECSQTDLTKPRAIHHNMQILIVIATIVPV